MKGSVGVVGKNRRKCSRFIREEVRSGKKQTAPEGTLSGFCFFKQAPDSVPAWVHTGDSSRLQSPGGFTQVDFRFCKKTESLLES